MRIDEGSNVSDGLTDLAVESNECCRTDTSESAFGLNDTGGIVKTGCA